MRSCVFCCVSIENESFYGDAVADGGGWQRLLCSPTPKTGSPSQASKTHMTEAQPTAAPSASDKDDKRDDVTSPTTASRTKEQTPPRPRYTPSTSLAVVLISRHGCL